MFNNNVAAVRKVYLAFSLTAIIREPLDLNMRNFVR